MAKKQPGKTYLEIKAQSYSAIGFDSIYEDVLSTGRKRATPPSGTVINAAILPLSNQTLLPFQHALIEVEDIDRQTIAMEAMMKNEAIVVAHVESSFPECVLDANPFSLNGGIGVIAIVEDVQEGSNGTYQIMLTTSKQGRITNANTDLGVLCCDFRIEDITKIKHIDAESAAISLFTDELYSNAVAFLEEQARKALKDKLKEFPKDSEALFHYKMQNSPIDDEGVYHIMTITDYEHRRYAFIVELEKALKILELRQEFHAKTMGEISQRQKDEFLRTQIRIMQNEIGDGDDEVAQLVSRAENKEWSKETQQAFEKELRRLQRYAPNTPDYAIQYSYLDTFLELPWQHCDRPVFELEDVEKTLDRDHYGLEKVKERIVEHMAVLKLRNDMKAPILCLYGPPGVGKTSLGKSVADALGRKYVRVALGGVHDEAEIRGHRRTYLGSMPGRIITALQECGTSDPVMVLDEIDKLGQDIKGDPSSALLEVLDPEQNCKFHDNYIDHDYDLSNVLFIATANDLSTISAPLLDRMELIEIGGYVEDEKIQIASRYLVPKNLELHGFERDDMQFTEDALHEIIEFHTRESGVRRLEKKIASVIRKQACKKASGKDYPHIIDANIVKEVLGQQEVFPDQYENNDIPGVVTGLAWTRAGGEILFIETSMAPGKEGKLTLTGNLGDVMKESATIALQFLKAHAAEYGLNAETMNSNNVHIHVPEGAVPKDGPSAGITMLTALASAFTGRKVRAKLAMTGEMTLRGRVLPVGGIKEKILAAKRAGITDVMLCSKNRKDIEEIKPDYISGLNFHYVDAASEVLDFALLPLE